MSSHAEHAAPSRRGTFWAPGDFRGNRTLLFLRGAIAILFGVVALLMPGPALFAILLALGFYLVLDGSLAILKAVRAGRAGRGWGWFLLEGIAGFAAAAAILLWPGLSLLVILMLLAAWAIVTGAFMLLAAFKAGPPQGRLWLLLGGVASLVWGVLIALAPPVAALVLTWWLAAYALIFGALLLAGAFSMPARAS